MKITIDDTGGCISTKKADYYVDSCMSHGFLMTKFLPEILNDEQFIKYIGDGNRDFNITITEKELEEKLRIFNAKH